MGLDNSGARFHWRAPLSYDPCVAFLTMNEMRDVPEYRTIQRPSVFGLYISVRRVLPLGLSRREASDYGSERLPLVRPGVVEALREN